MLLISVYLRFLPAMALNLRQTSWP
jgi:hypothetical protein